MAGPIAITGGGAFTSKNIANINSNFSQLFAGFTPGNLIYLWPSFGIPASGFPQAPDGSITAPYTDLPSAYAAGRPNKNDIIVLVGNGASTGSVRLSAGFTWAKSGLHMIGVSEPGVFSQRARIAPTTGVTAFANFFTISGSGCFFQNVQWFQGFTAGVAASICMTVTGSNNTFQNCQFAGMADTDAVSGTSSASRNLKISTGGENYFNHCVVGADTIARATSNASLELAGGTPRNVFEDCIFPSYSTNSGALTILGTGASCVDRFTLFNRCTFVNSIKSGSGTTQTVLGSFTNAAPGGLIVIKDSMSIGSTVFGDTNFLANSYIDMAAVSNSAGGLAVHPA